MAIESQGRTTEQLSTNSYHNHAEQQERKQQEKESENTPEPDATQSDQRTDTPPSAAEAPFQSWMKTYQPVLALVGTSALGALALSLRGPTPLSGVMPYFMGLALLFFATLKFFDMEGFKASFSEYDLITGRWPQYGTWYPYIELLLALGFLSGVVILGFAFLTMIVMSITATGITIALMNKKDLDCACVGSKLDIPLGSLSLVESVGMVLMSLVVIFQGFY